MFSGGLGSWVTAKRVADRHGTEDLWLVFADVKGKSTSPHAGEDADTYRFIAEASENVGGTLVALNEGRDIWQVFHDDRFLGNSRLANCSKFLKQVPCREWLDANCDPADTTVYVGIDWTETRRLPAITRGYQPFAALAPLTEPPYLDQRAMEDACRAEGIEPPIAYAQGFPHNNCGGFCVRSGQAQMQRLLTVNPERYAYHEAKEQALCDYLGKDVAVLRDRRHLRRGGRVAPLTLRRFRERLEAQPQLFDELDWGGCGCFVADDDTVTNTVEDAARFERERAEAAGEYDDRPTIRDI